MVREGRGITEYTFRHEWDDRHAWSSLSSYLEDRRLTDPVRQDGMEQVFFPFWLFSRNGDHRGLIPALSCPFPEIVAVTIPAGDLVYLAEKGEYPEPSVSLTEAMQRLPADGEPVKWSLVYIPLYLLEYSVREHAFTAVVSGADGKVFTLDSPASSGTRLSVSHLGMMVFFALLLILEGVLIRNHITRAGVFLLSFAVLYPLYLSLLKREVYR